MSSTHPSPTTATLLPTSGVYVNTTKSDYGSGNYLPAVEAFLTALYSIIFISAFALNGMVCYLFAKGKVKASSFNMLLLVLSISDMISIVLITPYVYLDLRKLSSASQQTLNYLCGITIGVTFYWISTFVSVLILCYISVNRFSSISHPTRALWLRRKRTICICWLFFWVISSCAGLPNLFAFRYDRVTGICYRDWPKGFNVTAFTFSTTFIGMVFPISLMMYTFLATVRTLWGQSSLDGTDSAVLKSRKRVVSILGILMLAYFLCSLPIAVYWIMSRATNYFPEGPKGEYLRVKVIRVVVLSAVSNTILDPIIYALRSNEFKQAFKQLFFHRRGELSSLDIAMNTSTTVIINRNTMSRIKINSTLSKFSTCE